MTPSPATPRVLVTGADGFIGIQLQRALMQRGIEHRAAVRAGAGAGDVRRCVVGDIGPSTDWGAALDGIDMVVHLAARAHVLRETATDPSAEFMRINAAATARLMQSAAAAGIRRFIYVSSVGVLGNQTGAAPFGANSPPLPHNAYARSKLAGEIAARGFGAGTDVVVLRLPLLYGPGVKANFLRLLRWVDQGRPLPLGAVRNRRSLLSVWNFCDFAVTALLQAAPAQGTWLLSDGEDLSTPELIRRIGSAMQRRVRLWPIAPGLLQTLARLAGRETQFTQLCGSLMLDIAETRAAFGWSPAVSVDEGLRRTVEWYLGR